MKQSISPMTFFAIVAVFVVLAGALVTWIWTRPSSTVEASGDGVPRSKQAGGASGSNAKGDHGGPNQDQQQQIQEWKKSHPDASTKY